MQRIVVVKTDDSTWKVVTPDVAADIMNLAHEDDVLWAIEEYGECTTDEYLAFAVADEDTDTDIQQQIDQREGRA